MVVLLCSRAVDEQKGVMLEAFGEDGARIVRVRHVFCITGPASGPSKNTMLMILEQITAGKLGDSATNGV